MYFISSLFGEGLFPNLLEVNAIVCVEAHYVGFTTTGAGF
jgi:hypothetical protein